MKSSFLKQCSRLSEAGYPSHLLISVAQKLQKKKTQCSETDQAQPQEKRKQKVAVIPYCHTLSHNLKKILNRAKVKVVFSAPENLAKISHRANPRPKKIACKINHQKQSVSCGKEIIYSIPLKCGQKYIGQTGRCLNDRLREHNIDVKNGTKGYLAAHCKGFRGCFPEFEKGNVIGRHTDQLTREVIEAFNILSNKDACVSAPSVFLSDKEMTFLSANL